MDLPQLSLDSLLDSIPDAAFIIDDQGRIVRANSRASDLFGYDAAELASRDVNMLVPESVRAVHERQVTSFLREPTPRELHSRDDLYGRRKDGTIFPADIWLNPIQANGVRLTLCVLMDISEQKRAKEALVRSEARFRGLFENLVEGFSLCQIIVEDGQAVDWTFTEVNPAFERLTGLKDVVGRRVTELIPGIRQSDPDLFEAYGRVAATGEPERFETYVRSLEMWWDVSVYSPEPGYFASIFDVITERKEAAEARKLFRALIDHSTDAIEVLDPETLRFIDVNQRACDDLGYSRQEYLSLTVPDIDPTFDLDDIRELRGELVAKGSMLIEGVHRRKDGSTFPVEVSVSYVRLDKEYLVVVARDVSERKASEERLSLFRALIDQSNDAIEVIDPETLRLLDVNQRACDVLGYTRLEYLGLTVFDINPDLTQDQASSLYDSLQEKGRLYIEADRYRKNGSTFPVEISLSSVRLDREYVVSIARDITERHQRKRELETIVQVGAALRAARGLDQMRPIILEELLSILNSEGAILVTPERGTGGAVIDLGAGDWTDLTNLRLDPAESIVGTVIDSAEPFTSERLADEPPDPASASLFGRRAVAAIPLRARDETIGALMVGRDSEYSPEDLRLLTAIGDMVANAIRRVTLHEQTERDALALARAYDSTIAGWSAALDLRDQETEGHTQRVTELTLQLARAAGLASSELPHVRRGALLHDIGKMGIPDSILLKPGKLTDEEWQIMRQHPVYAYNLLYPIEYLRPALEIPFCHHEKWDGSGYPRGLAGERIPWSARLFAVADVWDALRSDRPYRAAWSESAATDYIRQAAGSHFDPRAVELFFRVQDS